MYILYIHRERERDIPSAPPRKKGGKAAVPATVGGHTAVPQAAVVVLVLV